jgi:hypothetical protein
MVTSGMRRTTNGQRINECAPEVGETRLFVSEFVDKWEERQDVFGNVAFTALVRERVRGFH